MATILCFGDSNTWGSVPGEERRYGVGERWPAILRDALPAGHALIEEGQPGRTTVRDDPIEGEKNGLRYLGPCLESHIPDLVLILLGTNDLKHRFGLSAYDISQGAARLAQEVLEFESGARASKTKALLISPPPILEVGTLSEMFFEGEAKSRDLAGCYSDRAGELGCPFFDAGTVVESSKIDGIHWEATQHKRLAEALVPVVRSLI